MTYPNILQINFPSTPLPAGTRTTLAEVKAAIAVEGPTPLLLEAQAYLWAQGKSFAVRLEQ